MMTKKQLFQGLIIMLFLLTATTYFLDRFLKENTPMWKRKEYFDLKKRQVRVLIMGDSHGCRNVDPAVFGKKCFSIANGSETWVKTEAMFRLVINEAPEIKYVIFTYNYHQPFVSDCTIENKLHGGMYFLAYGLSFCLIPEGFQRISMLPYTKLPMWKMIKESMENTSLLVVNEQGFSPLPSSKGFASAEDAVTDAKQVIASQSKILSDAAFLETERSIKSILSEAERQGINVVFVRTPLTSQYFALLEPTYYNKGLALMRSVLSAHPGAHFVDHSTAHSIKIDSFHDSHHLTAAGAENYTREYLKPALDSLWGKNWHSD